MNVFIKKGVKMSFERENLISRLEQVVTKHIYNNGRQIRYPVDFEDGSRFKKSFLEVNEENEDIFYSGRYTFGANELYIYQAIEGLLDYLEIYDDKTFISDKALRILNDVFQKFGVWDNLYDNFMIRHFLTEVYGQEESKYFLEHETQVKLALFESLDMLKIIEKFIIVVYFSEDKSKETIMDLLDISEIEFEEYYKSAVKKLRHRYVKKKIKHKIEHLND